MEGILLIYGIDRLFDMGRTTINIVGDAACAVIVSRLEAKKEAKKAEAKKARQDKLKRVFIVVVCVILALALTLPTMGLLVLGGNA